MAKERHDALRRTRVERMLKEARARAADSELLSRSAAKQSDADYLLSLLAFEILLKAAHLVHVGTPKRIHSYVQLFNALPAEVQSGLVKAALERMSTSADYSDMPKLLSLFSRNFISLRYPYEAYEDLSSDEYVEFGESWVARGACEEDATFVYHPEELFGLTHALERHLQAWLESSPS